MSEIILPLSMALLTLAGILVGYRVGMVLAGAAAIFILVSDLPTAFFNLLVSRIYANVLSNWLLVAIPMFIFMGLVLEVSGTAERSLKAAQRALGGSAAGMGFSVLIIGVLLAASSGIVGASVVLLSLLALPRLVEAGYSDRMSAGLVTASGTLAILIPPSIML
ncbi:MAG: TRAP transporter large permease subunit, partial [Pseudomonadota bacterium]